MLDNLRWKFLRRPKGARRHHKWPLVRDLFIRFNKSCAACGSKKRLEVHHVIPFHVDKSQELEIANLITLCRRCHLFVGHLGNFRRYNPECRNHSLFWREVISGTVQ